MYINFELGDLSWLQFCWLQIGDMSLLWWSYKTMNVKCWNQGLKYTQYPEVVSVAAEETNVKMVLVIDMLVVVDKISALVYFL